MPAVEINEYDVGQQVRCTAIFQDTDDNDVDPTTVKFKWRLRHANATWGTVTTYTYPATVQKTAVGHYYCDVEGAMQGEYYYRFEGEGTVDGAAESHFRIRKSRFT